MSAHTPGPWAIDRDTRSGMEWNNHIVSAGRPDFTVCFMTHDGTEENEVGEANARLIAAAPELLEALRQCRKALAFFHGDEGWTLAETKILDLARAAIAKATGGGQ